MSSISVLFYGYKSKDLPLAVQSLIDNQSGQNQLDIYVYDQTNLSRDEKFQGIRYNHVYWDNRQSPFIYLEETLNNVTTDFFLYINGAVKFERNWDMELVMGHGGRQVVISGNHNIAFNTNVYKFYPSYNKIATQVASITNWISNDFIFMRLEMFKNFPKLSQHLKCMGIEEVFSAYAFSNRIPVQCIATPWANRIDDEIFTHDYNPYSLKHGYSKVIDMFKGKNIFYSEPLDIAGFSSVLNFDFSQLNYLPFYSDDVSYDPKMEMDAVGEERFSTNVRSIR
jgi:hypothetical protein